MKSKYGIGLFVLIFVLVYILSSDMYGKYQTKEETNETIESVTTDGEILNENCYYLREVNGYVVIFLSDKKTVYEYTDILYDDLPEVLMLEIQNGKYIKNENELYGFLENYSS